LPNSRSRWRAAELWSCGEVSSSGRWSDRRAQRLGARRFHRRMARA